MIRDYAIATESLTRRYGSFEAVSGLDLRVPRRQITGFLGRNGAGKSTTIKMLLGITRPSSGWGTVLGHSIGSAKESCAIRREVAWVGEEKQLYGNLTVAELIRFTASFYRDWQPETAQQLLARYDLPPHRRIQTLSKGMRTKLALLLAFARRPALLILDEPSDGLDPVSIEDLLQTLVAKAAEGATIFFSSHQIADVERIADRVAMIDRGKLVADLSLDEMRQDYRRITLGFAAESPAQHFDIDGVRGIRTSGRQMVVWAQHCAEAVVERARHLGAVSCEVEPVSLRELFLETVKGESGGSPQ